ncbi:hypothetical protein L1987_85636 [Smallanthus sonchifolius]|uniref:Uncharacterized protein n=1 Tax=Smallanthus sonchifolius TaxID=185202 RepID=A0ACB8Y192_9ASTR|nr:hypothetical protein L1987_85636 [Smallanthus sonchifolius]
MESSNACNLQIYDFRNVLSLMRRKVLYCGELGEFNLNSMREGIKLQLKEVGVLNDISGDQIEKMEKKQIDMIIGKNEVNAYDPIKNLNDMKISLIYIEWNVLNLMRRNVLYRGELGEFNLNSTREGIKLPLKEVGVLNDISGDQIEKMEKKQIDMIIGKNEVNAYDSTKKLNDMKISLIYIEWYMNTRKPKGGYYDLYGDWWYKD